MEVREILSRRVDELSGRRITRDEVRYLSHRLPMPESEFLIEIMSEYPLAGCSFLLPKQLDQSGFGVDMKWMSPEEMISEITDCYPGVAVVSQGYIPVGICLKGSGDPYFIELAGSNPKLVRILHDNVYGSDNLASDFLELVSPCLSNFFTEATIS